MSQQLAGPAAGDADVARVATLIGEPARARVLMALLDGRALPASVLAAEAGVTASTISEHLARLRAADLLIAERQGRARYYRLARPGVADALEALARIAPPEPIRSLRQSTRAHALRRARTCYNHLAGKLGVSLMTALLDGGVLTGGDGRYHRNTAQADRLSAPGCDLIYRLSAEGHDRLIEFGLDLDAVLRKRDPIRYCLDWSEQCHHLAGPLGTALTNRLFELDWIRHADAGRAVQVTEPGHVGLCDTFGIPDDWSARPTPTPSW